MADVHSQVGQATEVLAMAAEMFFTAAGPALIRQVAAVLGPRDIPIMPLKGVLLQKLVYGSEAFRQISDVDLLVPQSRFAEAWPALVAAGFTKLRWETGDWQVVMRNPDGLPLALDLHRRLTRTTRSRLTSAGLFARGRVDTELFDVPVTLPSGDDLFAHLIQHASLHWISRGELHHPEDFRVMTESQSLALDVQRCIAHLHEQGLVTHALVVLPMVHRRTGGTFLQRIIESLARSRKASTIAHLILGTCDRYVAGHFARRLAGVALSSSLPTALASAALDRLATSRRR